MTRQEFLALPKYPWSPQPLQVKRIFFVQTRRKHDSGFACMVSAANIDGKLQLLGTCHDIIEITGHCRIDCDPKNGVFSLLNNNKGFLIKHRMSELDIETIA